MIIPKYAELEIERRFIVPKHLCPDLADRAFKLITDRYISDSRLRLRAMVPSDGGPAEFKFCKKYESTSALAAPIVNIYLDANEHEILSRLPGKQLRKCRYRIDHAAKVFALDVFLDELDGLLICEVEAATVSAIRELQLPSWAAIEVTKDAFFIGGNLCQMSAAELNERLSRL